MELNIIKNGTKVKQNSTSSHCRINHQNLSGTNSKTLKNNVMNITGRLTRDAQVRTTSQGKQVVTFSVAVNDNYKNKQGERIEQTAFFDCSYWITPNVAKLLTKGLLVELTGRLSARAWISGDAEPKASLNFHTSNIKLLGGSRRNDTPQAAIATPANNAPVDDLPF